MLRLPLFGAYLSWNRIGQLRLSLPRAVPPYEGTIHATTFGNMCIQQTTAPLKLPRNLPPAAVQYVVGTGTAPQDISQDEDCLNLNVIVPATTTAKSKLPVVVVSKRRRYFLAKC